MEGLKIDLCRKLESLLEKRRTEDNLADIIDTKLYLNLEIEKDGVYLEQRVRANWLNLGDKSITFFHNSAPQRKQANTTGCLRDKEGKDVRSVDEMGKITTNFFRSCLQLEDRVIWTRFFRELRNVFPYKQI